MLFLWLSSWKVFPIPSVMSAIAVSVSYIVYLENRPTTGIPDRDCAQRQGVMEECRGSSGVLTLFLYKHLEILCAITPMKSATCVPPPLPWGLATCCRRHTHAVKSRCQRDL